MLLARSFVLGLSPRAVLAVAALALSIAYALVSAGALGGLDAEAATLDEAREHPGHVLFDEIAHEDGLLQASSFASNQAPTGSLLVDWSYDTDSVEGLRHATLRLTGSSQGLPDLKEPQQIVVGPWAPSGAREHADDLAEAHNLSVEQDTLAYLPLDAVVLPTELYDTLHPSRGQQARLAYVPGDDPPATDLQHADWQGIGGFYENGAAQLNSGLVGIVLATGIIAALLSSGLVYLEILARHRDLVTIETLGGRALVRRLIILRTVALVTAGLVAGTFVSLAALRLAGAAMGTQLHPRPLLWIGIVLAVGTGALVAGALVGLRAFARHSLRDAGTSGLSVRRFPGPVRFLMVTPRVFAGVFAATFVTTTILIAITGAIAVPGLLFEAEDDQGIQFHSAGSGNILRGSVDRMLAEHGHVFDSIAFALGETYAPTVIDGDPIMVRGVEQEEWREHRQARLTEGAWPSQPGEATIGLRAHRATGMGPGDHLLVPASYHHGAEPVKIIGVHRTDGIEDDQIISDLDTAGRLAGIGPDRVTGIRVVFTDPETDTLPRARGVAGTSIDIIPADPIPHTRATARVYFLNFNQQETEHTFTLRVNGDPQGDTTALLAPRTMTPVDVPFVVPDAPTVRLDVNPSEEVPTRSLTLEIEAPELARPGSNTPITVLDADGRPLEGAQVRVDGEDHSLTDADGRATIAFDDPGLADIVAEHDGDAGHVRLRVAPSDWDDSPHLVAGSLQLESGPLVGDDIRRVEARVWVTNLGGQDHDDDVVWTIDGETQEASLTIASGTETRLTRSFELTEGSHTIEILGETQQITVSLQKPRSDTGGGGAGDGGSTPSTPRANSAAEAVAIRLEQSGSSRDDGESDPLDVFLARVLGNLDGATFLIVFATVIHGGSLVWVSILRDVREREKIPHLLRRLGADEDQVRSRTVRDTVLSVAPAIVLGLLLAPLALRLTASWGYPAAFGHTIPAPFDPAFLIRLGVTILVVAVLAAVYGVYTNRAESDPTGRRRPLPEWFRSAAAAPQRPAEHPLAPPRRPGGPP